jgi:ATP-binding cassette, subfamily B, multidrug efflux pump
MPAWDSAGRLNRPTVAPSRRCHRLSILRGASTILVVKGGRIAEQGTAAGLLALHGVYAELVHAQAEPEGTGVGA